MTKTSMLEGTKELSDFVEKAIIAEKEGKIDGYYQGCGSKIFRKRENGWFYRHCVFEANPRFGQNEIGYIQVSLNEEIVWGMTYNGFVHEFPKELLSIRDRDKLLRAVERFYKLAYQTTHAGVFNASHFTKNNIQPYCRIQDNLILQQSLREKLKNNSYPGNLFTWTYQHEVQDDSTIASFRGREIITIEKITKQEELIDERIFRFERQYQGGLLVPLKNTHDGKEEVK